MALAYGGSILVSTGMGAAAGAFFGGAGALPGALIGASVGTEAGGWLLAYLGLKSLVEGLGASIPEALRCYERGFRQAWGATPKDRDHWMGPRDIRANVSLAAFDIARGHVILITAMLSALLAYVTRGKGDAKAAAIEEIRQSARLGPKVADWIVLNEGELAKQPKLRPRRPWGAAPEEGAQASRVTANAREQPEAGTGPVPQAKPRPGSPDHKALRWRDYQGRAGKMDYAQWSRQYDVNMRNYQYGLAREAKYREAMGASQGTLKTPLTNRQIDILKLDDMYAGQVKTGPVSLTKENALAIDKDAELVKRNWRVEHLLEQGASKPYLEALERAGIDYRIGPQIPRGSP